METFDALIAEVARCTAEEREACSAAQAATKALSRACEATRQANLAVRKAVADAVEEHELLAEGYRETRVLAVSDGIGGSHGS